MGQHDAVYEESYKGYKIEIYQDEDAENPREWDNLGTMVCHHSRYNLGDKEYYTRRSFTPEELFKELASKVYPTDLEVAIDRMYDRYGEEEARRRELPFIQSIVNKHYVILPLYLYDHSGITMSTGAFNDSWDSGQVGYIFISYDKIRKEFPIKSEYGKGGVKQTPILRRNVTKALLKRVKENLEREVKVYDDYLTGNIYGYKIAPIPIDGQETDETLVDSCWGFLGGYDNKENGALAQAKSVINYREKKKKQGVKT